MLRLVNAKKTLKTQVMDITKAEELGKVTGYGINAETKKVDFVVYDKGSKARLVPWSAITGIGPDAVMVSEPSKIRTINTPEEEAIANGEKGLLGQKIISLLGNSLGEVEEFEFDADTGYVSRVVTDQLTIEGEALMVLGSYATLVSANVDPAGEDHLKETYRRRPIGAIAERAESTLEQEQEPQTPVASQAEKDLVREEFLQRQNTPITPPVEVTWIDVDSTEIDKP